MLRAGTTFCSDELGLQFYCRFQATADAVHGILVVAIVYCLGAAVLGYMWVFTQPSNPPCPVCQSRSRNDYGICKWCGHNFLPPPSGPA